MKKIVFGTLLICCLVLTLLLLIEYHRMHKYVRVMQALQQHYREYVSTFKHLVEQQKEVDIPEAQFLVVNRDADYLLESTITYLKENRMSHVLQPLTECDEWLAPLRDYVSRHDQRSTTGRKSKKMLPVVHGITSEQIKALRHDLALLWPIDRDCFWLSSFFGPRHGKFHYGIDMASISGTKVKAAQKGRVVEAGNGGGYGNVVVIRHNAKYRTRYAHLKHIAVKIGDKVEQGQYIGKVGSTGHVIRKRGKDPSHLHFEVEAYGKRINPLYFLN